MDLLGPLFFQPNVVRDGFGYKVSGYVIVLEAWRRGLTVTLLDSRLRKFRVSDEKGREVSFIGPRPVSPGASVVKDKYRTNELLSAAGVPVPESVLIDQSSTSLTRLKEFATEIGYPVVLKPRDGSFGRGVFANIKDEAELERCFLELSQQSPNAMLVLESHIPGDDFRVLVYEDQYVAACRRTPANITGNGVSTVKELLDAKNRIRRKNPHLSTGLIKKDFEVTEYLARKGYTYDSVPSAGEYIQLRAAANASAGGDVVDVTDELPQNIRESAVRAVQAIPGILCAGVDVLVDGETGKYAILELNWIPQIAVNMYPSVGEGVDVPKKVLDLYFPDSPRPDSESDARLSVTVKPVLDLLASGLASEVTLSPVPESRYRTRVVFDFDLNSPLTKAQRSKILAIASEHEIAGFLRFRDGRYRVMAASSSRGVEAFRESLATKMNLLLLNRRKWNGAVHSGFVLED